jgi:hypothetical protein
LLSRMRSDPVYSSSHKAIFLVDKPGLKSPAAAPQCRRQQVSKQHPRDPQSMGFGPLQINNVTVLGVSSADTPLLIFDYSLTPQVALDFATAL